MFRYHDILAFVCPQRISSLCYFFCDQVYDCWLEPGGYLTFPHKTHSRLVCELHPSAQCARRTWLLITHFGFFLSFFSIHYPQRLSPSDGRDTICCAIGFSPMPRYSGGFRDFQQFESVAKKNAHNHGAVVEARILTRRPSLAALALNGNSTVKYTI